MTVAVRAPKFPLVQALRAVAAFSVALTHILFDALGMVPNAGPLRSLYQAMPWGAGVDIFFVISGFVIVHASSRLFTAAGGARRFLLRRLARIVPLYWLMTSLFLVEVVFFPGTINGAMGGAGFIIKSYFFIPCARPDGLVQPVFGLGWTLNYEMFFYFAFVSFLFLHRERAVIAATIVLGLFVMAGQMGVVHGVILQTWSDPIILEFCAGMLLALLAGKFAMPGLLRVAIVIGALLLLHLHPGWNRVLADGVPAAALVFACVTGGPDRNAGKLPKFELWLVMLGDASYALYLVHPFVMRAMGLLWLHLHKAGGIYFYTVICLAISQTAAIAIHYFFERPVTTRLRARFEPETGTA